MSPEGRLDETTIRVFVNEQYPRLVAAIALVTGSRASAEDAAQEALARAWERSERGETIASLPAWVTAVAFNLARSSLRRIVVERRLLPRLAIDDRDPSAEQADRIALAAALRALPRRQREATVLHYYLGMSVTETAAALRLREGTIKACLHRARHALARALGVPDGEEVSTLAEP